MVNGGIRTWKKKKKETENNQGRSRLKLKIEIQTPGNLNEKFTAEVSRNETMVSLKWIKED